MGIKTISLENSAYEKLRAAKSPGKSFSDVIWRILSGREPSFSDFRGLVERPGRPPRRPPSGRSDCPDEGGGHPGTEGPASRAQVSSWVSRSTVDSNFIIDVFQSDAAALAKSDELDRRTDAKLLSIPVLYEIPSGLLYTRSRSEARAFRSLASCFVLLPFDEAAAMKAAEIRPELMRMGRVKSHVDVMIAGVAAATGHTLVSRDRDFRDIADVVGLVLESY